MVALLIEKNQNRVRGLEQREGEALNTFCAGEEVEN